MIPPLPNPSPPPCRRKYGTIKIPLAQKEYDKLSSPIPKMWSLYTSKKILNYTSPSTFSSFICKLFIYSVLILIPMGLHVFHWHHAIEWLEYGNKPSQSNVLWTLSTNHIFEISTFVTIIYCTIYIYYHKLCKRWKSLWFRTGWQLWPGRTTWRRDLSCEKYNSSKGSS